VRTSLAEGPGPLLAALTRTFGIDQVTVVEYEAGGGPTKVPEGARAFTVEGDVYRNPWLGLEAHKPAGFRFTLTDRVYPDTAVVAVEGPGGRRVRVRLEAVGADGDGARALRGLGFSGKPAREVVAGRSSLVVEGAGKAGLAFAQGPDLWVLTAEGEQAGELLRRVAALVTVRAKTRPAAEGRD
jgi:hypothetical protein